MFIFSPQWKYKSMTTQYRKQKPERSYTNLQNQGLDNHTATDRPTQRKTLGLSLKIKTQTSAIKELLEFFCYPMKVSSHPSLDFFPFSAPNNIINSGPELKLHC